jgi:heptosyltransferase-1
VVHTLPLAHALKEGIPGSYIVWIVEEHERIMVADNPAVDEVVVGPSRRWRREALTPWGAVRVLREMGALRRRLRSLRIDVAIDVQGLPKSSLFTLLTGAPRRVGFGWLSVRDPFAAFFTNRHVDPGPSVPHIVDQNLRLLSAFEVEAGTTRFPLPPFAQAEDRTDRFLREHALSPSERLVVLLPGTRGLAKQWPPERYADLAVRLSGLEGVRLALVGSPAEEDLLARVGAGLDARRPIRFTGPIDELVSLLRRAALVLGNDTGPLHIAAALNRPTIGLFGPTRAERTGPYGPEGRSIQSPTRRMRDIGLETVVGAALERLGIAAPA